MISDLCLLTLMTVCLSLVHSDACAVWSVPVHGGVVSQRHSGKICYIFHVFVRSQIVK